MMAGEILSLIGGVFGIAYALGAGLICWAVLHCSD